MLQTENIVYEVDKIDFILYDYLYFTKAERISFYINILNTPINLSDFETRYGFFLYGLSIKLKNKNEIQGNETIIINQNSEVCFFYCQYRLLFFIDISHSMQIYDYDSKVLNVEKIEHYLQLTIKTLLKFDKDIYTLKFEKKYFKPKLIFSFLTSSIDDELRVLPHDMELTEDNYQKFLNEIIFNKLKNITSLSHNKNFPMNPHSMEMNSFTLQKAQNTHFNIFLKSQMTYMNKILEMALFIIELLPLEANPILFLLTDSNFSLSQLGEYNNILAHLGRIDMTIQILDLQPHQNQINFTPPGYTNNVSLMKYIAEFSGGNYLSENFFNESFYDNKRKQYSYYKQNLISYDNNTSIINRNNKFTDNYINCRVCQKNSSLFFCRKAFNYPHNEKQIFFKKKHELFKNITSFNIFSLNELPLTKQMKITFYQKEIFETYILKAKYDLILEARARESFVFHHNANISKSQTKTSFHYYIFPQVIILYTIAKIKKENNEKEKEFNKTVSLENEEYIIKIKLQATFNELCSLKEEFLKSKKAEQSKIPVNSRVEVILCFIKEIMCTDKIIEYFCTHFSEDNDLQSEKENFLIHNKLLLDSMSNLSIHTWHRFFNMEVIELLIKNRYEHLENDLISSFLQKNRKSPFIFNCHKKYIEDQIYKFCDYQKKDLHFGLKLIPKSFNGLNKKYMNAFLVIKFNWIGENFCIIYLAFFQAFHFTRIKFQQKFIDDLNNSTKHNDIRIEISFRHLTSLLPSDINSSSSSNIDFNLSRGMKKRMIENIYTLKDHANLKKERGSIFTFRASKKLINCFLYKKSENYATQSQALLILIVKYLILQRMKEDFTILNWNFDSIMLVKRIQIAKVNEGKGHSNIQIKQLYLLYSINISINNEQITTELFVEPNSGFFVYKYKDEGYKIYKESLFLDSIVSYFFKTENKIFEWVKCYSFIVTDAINYKSKQNFLRNQIKELLNFYYFNEQDSKDYNPKQYNEKWIHFLKDLNEYKNNFCHPKKTNLTADSFMRIMTYCKSKIFQISINQKSAEINKNNLIRLHSFLNEFMDNIKDYFFQDCEFNKFFGIVFSKTTLIFFLLPSKENLLNQLKCKYNYEGGYFLFELKFYFISADILKQTINNFEHVLKRAECFNSISIDSIPKDFFQKEGKDNLFCRYQPFHYTVQSVQVLYDDIDDVRDIIKDIIDNIKDIIKDIKDFRDITYNKEIENINDINVILKDIKTIIKDIKEIKNIKNTKDNREMKNIKEIKDAKEIIQEILNDIKIIQVNKEIKDIKDNSIFENSFKSFFSNVEAFISYFINLEITYNKLLSYILYEDNNLSQIIKHAYSFQISFSLTDIVSNSINTKKVGTIYLYSKLDEILNSFFIHLNNNFYSNERAFVEDDNYENDTDIGFSYIFTSSNHSTDQFYFIMEIYIYVNNKKIPFIFNQDKKLKTYLNEINYTNKDELELEVIYYFIPSPDDFFNEATKEKNIAQLKCETTLITNKNTYSLYYSEKQGQNDILSQIPLYIELDKEDYFIKINSKLKKAILHFDKNLQSLKNIILLENMRENLNSKRDTNLFISEISKGNNLLKNIWNKFFYGKSSKFELINKDNFSELMKYECLDVSDFFTLDFQNDLSLQSFKNEIFSKYDSSSFRVNSLYRMPVWFKLTVSKTAERRRGSLDLTSNQVIYVDIKWIRLFDEKTSSSHDFDSQINEITNKLEKIISDKIKRVNQRILLEMIHITNEYNIENRNINNNSLFIDESKQHLNYYFKKDINSFFSNPFHDNFTLPNKRINDVYKYLKSHFSVKYPIKNITDYYKLDCPDKQTIENIFIVKISVDELQGQNSIFGRKEEMKENKWKKHKKISKLTTKLGKQVSTNVILPKTFSNGYGIHSGKSNLNTAPNISSPANYIDPNKKSTLLFQLYGLFPPCKTVIKLIKDLVKEKILIVKLNEYISILDKTKEIKKLQQYKVFNPQIYKKAENPMQKKIENIQLIEQTLQFFFNKTKEIWEKARIMSYEMSHLDIEILETFSERINLKDFSPHIDTLSELSFNFFNNLNAYFRMFRTYDMKIIDYGKYCKKYIIFINHDDSIRESSYLFLVNVVNEGDSIDEKYVNTYELVKKKENEDSDETVFFDINENEQLISMVFNFIEDLLYLTNVLHVFGNY